MSALMRVTGKQEASSSAGRVQVQEEVVGVARERERERERERRESSRQERGEATGDVAGHELAGKQEVAVRCVQVQEQVGNGEGKKRNLRAAVGARRGGGGCAEA